MISRELLQKIVDAQVHARELRACAAEGTPASFTPDELAEIAAALEALSDATIDMATTPPPEDPRAYERRRKREQREKVREAAADAAADAAAPVPDDVREGVRDNVRDTEQGTPSSPTPAPSPAPPTPPPTPSTPGLLAAGGSAREASPAAASQTEPPSAPPSDVAEPIAGVVIGELRQWAIQLTTAANQGITAAIGEQTRPIRADLQLDAAEEIMATGVPLELARSVVRTEAEKATTRSCGTAERRKRGGRPPKSLAYFAGAVRDAWAASEENRRARETPEPEALPVAAAGGAPRGSGPRPGAARAGVDAFAALTADAALRLRMTETAQEVHRD